MPLIDIKAEDGTPINGWICGPGLKPCFVCGVLATKQCDYLMKPKPSRARCNRHLCAAHATELGPNKDACPEHAPICLAAIARRESQLASLKASA